MNLTRFFDTYKVNEDAGNALLRLDPPQLTRVDGEFLWVIETIGGKSFGDGIYRVLKGDQIQQAKESMEQVFPEFRGRMVPFGYDWLGRHFAVDFARLDGGRPQVLMLEVGAGEAMEIPATISEFHNFELVDSAHAALASGFFGDWRAANPTLLPAYSQCVGYKVPLFLGGKDNLANLEISDLSVYVEICGQLRIQTRSLPPGAEVRKVVIE